MLNVIYDGTILLNMMNKDSSRSGVFFCVKNVFDELRKNPNVSLSLYFAPEHILKAMKFKELYAKDVQCVNIIPKPSFWLLINKFFWAVHTKLFTHKYLRLPFSVGILFSQKAMRYFHRNCYKKEIVQSSQVFLAPARMVPKSIRCNSNLLFFTILHDAIPLLSDYMGSAETKNHELLIRSFGQRDYFFPNSKQTESDFKKFSHLITSSTSFVIPHAASSEIRQILDCDSIEKVKTKYGIPKEKKYVFSLCTLEPRKNLLRAVGTFCSFVKKYDIADLVWVLGGGHWDAFLKEMDKECIQWNPNIIIKTGYIDDEDRSALYSGAEWFVYTSRYEGFGVPPLEAMQCGCPVITSNSSSLPEVVGDAGIMIDWDSDEQHVEAYKKYYFDEELRKENSRKGLERAKMFSWKKTVDKMIDVMISRF